MTIPAEYTAGQAATYKALKTAINADVPVMFQGEIPEAALQTFATTLAKAAIDAAAAVRAQHS